MEPLAAGIEDLRCGGAWAAKLFAAWGSEGQQSCSWRIEGFTAGIEGLQRGGASAAELLTFGLGLIL